MSPIIAPNIDYSHIADFQIPVNSFCGLKNHRFEDLIGVTLRFYLQKLLLVFKFLLLLSVLFGGDELGGLELSKSQSLDFSLVVDSESDGSFLLFVVKFFLLLSELILHLSLLNFLLVLGLRLSDLNFELLGVHDTLLLLDG